MRETDRTAILIIYIDPNYLNILIIE